MQKDIALITPRLIEEECGREGICKVSDDFYLFNRCEDLPFSDSPRQLSGIVIILCLGGSMSVNVCDRVFTIGRNECLVINSVHVINCYSYTRDCRCLAIYGTSDFYQEVGAGWNELSSLFLSIRQKSVITLSDQEVTIFRDYFNAIQNRVQWGRHRFLRKVTTFLFSAMVLDLGHLIWDQHDTDDGVEYKKCDKVFSDFIRLVENNYLTQRRVAWYAEQLNITPKYLSEIVKNSSRQTPNEWIEKYVVMEIRSLLRNSTLSIKEITERMGFPNQSFLGKYFKQRVGISPSAYRRH